MAPVDAELAALLERLSEHTLETAGNLRREFTDLRRAVDDDRRRADERHRETHEALAALDAKCGALVVEDEDEDGNVTVRARKPGIGGGTWLIVLTAVIVPIVVAYLSGGH